MGWSETEAEFDLFADAYDLVFRSRQGDPIFPHCRSALTEREPRNILDCACGQGGPAIALSLAGLKVTGTDISGRLIRLARKHAKRAGAKVTFRRAGWEELPRTYDGKFDFVMCHGNAIGHCPGERAMVRSLKAMRRMLHPGGTIYLDTRSWEHVRSELPLYRLGPAVDQDGARHRFLFRNSVPRRWADPHVSEAIQIIEGEGEPELRTFRVTFFAFRRRELMDRIRRAGFDNLEVEPLGGDAGYSIVARAI